MDTLQDTLSHELNTLSLTTPPVSYFVARADVLHVAHALGNYLRPGDWVFLDGDLGAGKTALAQQVSIYYGAAHAFTSPTFSLIHADKVTPSATGIEKILHLDLYRIKSGKELCFIGLEQEFNARTSIALIEWPDVVDEADWHHFFQMTKCPLPKRILNIQIDIENEGRRYQFKLATMS